MRPIISRFRAHLFIVVAVLSILGALLSAARLQRPSGSVAAAFDAECYAETLAAFDRTALHTMDELISGNTTGDSFCSRRFCRRNRA